MNSLLGTVDVAAIKAATTSFRPLVVVVVVVVVVVATTHLPAMLDTCNRFNRCTNNKVVTMPDTCNRCSRCNDK